MITPARFTAAAVLLSLVAACGVDGPPVPPSRNSSPRGAGFDVDANTSTGIRVSFASYTAS